MMLAAVGDLLVLQVLAREDTAVEEVDVLDTLIQVCLL
jgi:hypothetical protein